MMQDKHCFELYVCNTATHCNTLQHVAGNDARQTLFWVVRLRYNDRWCPQTLAYWSERFTFSLCWYDAFICVMCRIYMCHNPHSYASCLIEGKASPSLSADITHSCVWCVTFVCAICFIHTRHGPLKRRLLLLSLLVWRFHVCDMSHSCVSSASFICVTRLASCHATHSYVRDINESCHTYEWGMSEIWMSHVTHMNQACQRYEWVMSHIWMRHVRDMNESCHTYEWGMSEIWMSHVTHSYVSCASFTCVICRIHMWVRTRVRKDSFRV